MRYRSFYLGTMMGTTTGYHRAAGRIVLHQNTEPDSVVIVGAGPTGCTLALLLARAGIHTTLLEQNEEPQQHPAACILNTRTMEIFREIGVESQIITECQNIFEHGSISWVVSLAGRRLGHCSALPDDLDAILALSPTHTVQFPQNRLERILWRAIEAQPEIDFKRNHRVIGATLDRDGVVVEVERKDRERLSVRAGYLVASDGASSSVRRSLGIEMDGPVLQQMIGIHFHSDLSHLVSDRKSILYWVLNRQLVGVIIAHWMPSEWVLFAPFFPPQQTPEQFTEAVCRELVNIACGVSPGDLQIKAIRPWALSARLARSFRKGNVFLAGDAAHSFPPTGGLGLNTGVQDSHNLAWKLTAVIGRRVSPGLLDTYESERQPIARVNHDHSLQNFFNTNALNKAAGLDWERLKTLEKLQSSWAVRCWPSRLQQGLIAAIVKRALGTLAQLDGEGAHSERLRGRFRALIPGQEAHYRFTGLDLGFAYTDGVVIPEQAPKPEAADPVIDYLPTTWPGARLPHLWVRRGDERISLLDLPEADTLILLTHPPGRQRWQDAAAVLQNEVLFRLNCVSVGSEGSSDLIDEHATWPRLSQIGDLGAILVRPDGHVAWRCQTAPVDPLGALRDVLRKLRLYASPDPSFTDVSEASWQPESRHLG